MIELKDVSVTFKNRNKTLKAVENINLKIKRGEIFGIIGLSGAGKSTLIRTINLLQKPTTGRVIIDGQDITNLKGEELRKVRLRIGMIFQHFNLINGKTVAQNIEFVLKANGYSKNLIKKKVSKLLTIVGLEDKAHVYPSNLSGGQKQRVGIARALANNPEILLCDEATSALDLETTEDILNLLKEINLKYRITIVFITHEMEVAKKIFSRVAVMNKGKIIESGEIYDIFSNPTDEITKSLVDKNFNVNLPKEVLDSINSRFLLKIYYRGKDSADPVISNVSNLFNVKISIIHGKIDYINGNPLGILIVNITGDINDVKGSINFIKDYVWKVEDISLSEEEEEKIG